MEEVKEICKTNDKRYYYERGPNENHLQKRSPVVSLQDSKVTVPQACSKAQEN